MGAAQIQEAVATRGSKPRQSISIVEAAKVADWTPQELAMQRGMQSHCLRNEQKRILHNRTAEGRNYHYVLPFTGANGRLQPKLRCKKCGEEAKMNMLAVWPQKRFEPRVATSMSSGRPARLRVGTILERLREKARKHNEEAERAEIKLHILQQPELTSEELPPEKIKCSRPNCNFELPWRRWGELKATKCRAEG